MTDHAVTESEIWGTVYLRDAGVLVAQMEHMRRAGDVLIFIDLDAKAFGGPLERWPGHPMEAGYVAVSRRCAATLVPLLESMTAGRADGLLVERVDASGPMTSCYLQLISMRPGAFEKLHVAGPRARRIARALRDFLAASQDDALASANPALADAWVIGHVATDTWWKPERRGYTSELLRAGVYTRAEAEQCVAARSPLADGTREDEAMPLLHAIPRLEHGSVGYLFGLFDRERATADSSLTEVMIENALRADSRKDDQQ